MGLDLLVSYDTTGSMYTCISEVKRRVEWLVEKVANEVPDVRFAVIAHGDYCDLDDSYVIKTMPFTRDADKVREFVRSVGPTHGGDNPECYELVLHTARNLDWGSDQRVMVLIGDDVPHSKGERQNYLNLDWFQEASILNQVGVTIHAVQCLDRSHANSFYHNLARVGHGRKLTLDQFSNVVELLLAVVYKQSGGDERLQRYAEELEAGALMNRGIAKFIQELSGDITVDDVYTTVRSDGLVPVHPSRFQVLYVPSRQSIQDFVDGVGARFAVGRGFYELTKKVLVQEQKEIIIQDALTGDMFTGEDAWDMIGLPRDSSGKRVRANITPTDVTIGGHDARVFIQSTSYNRVLLPDTRFLYEVEGWTD